MNVTVLLLKGNLGDSCEYRGTSFRKSNGKLKKFTFKVLMQLRLFFCKSSYFMYFSRTGIVCVQLLYS